MGSHGSPWIRIARHGLQSPPWNSIAPDQNCLARAFTSLLFGFGLLNCKVAQTYLKVFYVGIFGLVVFECTYAKAMHVCIHLVGACLLPTHGGPGPLQTCGICGFCYRISAFCDRCVGCWVPVCLAHVLNSCMRQLRNNALHRAPWPAYFDLRCKMCIVLFSFRKQTLASRVGEHPCCKLGFSAYLRSADSMRRS